MNFHRIMNNTVKDCVQIMLQISSKILFQELSSTNTNQQSQGLHGSIKGFEGVSEGLLQWNSRGFQGLHKDF